MSGVAFSILLTSLDKGPKMSGVQVSPSVADPNHPRLLVLVIKFRSSKCYRRR